jgi:prepilin-type N-terminal cleavage/methylation domain-containing protein
MEEPDRRFKALALPNAFAAAARSRRRGRCTDTRAFTLIELIIAMVIVGILAGYAATHSGTVTDIRASAGLLLQDIRFTQSLSMARSQGYRVYFYTTSYRITDAAGNAVAHPATGSPRPINLGSGQAFQSSGFSSGYLAFDSMGTPYNGSTPLSAATSISVTDGSQRTTVTVIANTGAVTIQ